ncbi:MAG: enoyl-CoA hydratase, partial [Proteobacteria bacterium]|nr:enoyl-CoA hydratase [Pseudomonadota bacterium]
RWGFYNRLVPAAHLITEALALAGKLAKGPSLANAMTKRQLNAEWDMGVEAAIDAEAEAQAVCMTSNDFRRAYEAFVNKEKPVFEGD